MCKHIDNLSFFLLLFDAQSMHVRHKSELRKLRRFCMSTVNVKQIVPEKPGLTLYPKL